MFIRPYYRRVEGRRQPYWALVESHRTARGPRQRVVAYLGHLDEAGRLGVAHAAQDRPDDGQALLFDEPQPQWVEVDASRVRVERCREFGGPWLGMELLRQLDLPAFLDRVMPRGQEHIRWPIMVQVLVLARLCHPSSELHIAEHFYESSALPELLGAPALRVNDDRLYRALDQLLPHKAELEVHLRNRLGELFDLDYDLLLYDVTSTYFEGQAQANPQAQRGYSRDQRGDCKQVCIGLVVSRCGMPVGYDVFAGNRRDVSTLQEIVQTMESRYGQANRIWCLDRGMVSDENMEFLRQHGRRYIVGTPKGMLKTFEREMLAEDWDTIREGLQVKRCPGPDSDETFILCRSADRAAKERAMHDRFEKRIEDGLRHMAAYCEKKNYKPSVINRRVGKLLGRNSRAAGLFEVDVRERSDGGSQVEWAKRDAWREWAELSEGCYLLRTNIDDWTPQDLWQAYIQLTEAEAAFRIHKSDLRIRPIWHQRQDRVQAHILVCFLAYVLWKTLGQLCRGAHLGEEPRRVLEEIQQIRMVDVVLPTRQGLEIRKRCVSRPTEHQAILLDHLGLRLPRGVKLTEM